MGILSIAIRRRSFRSIFTQAEKYVGRVAIVDQFGSHTYDELLHKSLRLAESIVETCGETTSNPKHQQHIAFLTGNNASYVVMQWATWMTGNVAVPLHQSHPPSQLEYYIQDSQSSLVMAMPDLAPMVEPIASKHNLKFLNSLESPSTGSTRNFEPVTKDFLLSDTNGLILYTSGTTGPPKGVVLTHANLHAQVDNMISSWEWTEDDTVLHALPLNHMHGLSNALLAPLSIGACCVMLPKFDAAEVWEHLLSTRKSNRVNIFMGVPTMYCKLLELFDAKYATSTRTKEFIRVTCKEKIRLMVSGSAALPQPVFEKWEEVTGHRLLERYGMTELGMALTNPLNGSRIPGCVGNPFPTTQVCIGKNNVYVPLGYEVAATGSYKGTTVPPGQEGEQGELFVKGPSVFKEYWNKPDATKNAFTKDRWFKTGDTAVFANGMYKILGRTSVDIIKSGGYKISALDIERQLLAHPDIKDCAVVGVPDPVWGQKIAAVIATAGGKKQLTLPELKDWCKDRMETYCIPTILKEMDSLPRNMLGKVNKKELTRDLFRSDATR